MMNSLLKYGQILAQMMCPRNWSKPGREGTAVKPVCRAGRNNLKYINTIENVYNIDFVIQ
jgi:hypothetical protein